LEGRGVARDPPDLFAMLRSAQPGEGYALRSLDAHQNATVVADDDLLIPETETPEQKVRA